MLLIHITAAISLFFLIFSFYLANGKSKPNQRIGLFLLFTVALCIRLTAAALSRGFGNDTACFAAWADRMFQVGPAGFYSNEMFTDYPPGYMYLLYPIGALRTILGIEYYSTLHLLLLKIPSVICDMVCAYLLYRESAKKLSGNLPLILCAAYLFNPAVILNSSIWGQADSVYTLALVIMCLMLIQGRMIPSYVAFCIGVLIKPQMLIFSPVLFVGMLDHLIFRDFSVKKLLTNVVGGLLSIGGFFVLCLPFGLDNVLPQYFSTISSYPYAAVNAYNFWGMFGLNWVSQENTIFGITYHSIGTVFLVLTITTVIFIGIRRKNDSEKYAFLCAFLMTFVFVFSVRMHERYLYPAVIMMLFACVYKPSRKLYISYGLFTILHFYNTAHVFFLYDPSNYDRKATVILLVSAGFVLSSVLFAHITRELYLCKKGMAENDCLSEPLKICRMPSPSVPVKKLVKADFMILICITLVYSCVALYDLGDRKAPVTTYNLSQNETIVLDFGSVHPSAVSYYIAPWHDRHFTITGTTSKDTGESKEEICFNTVFTWKSVPINCTDSRIFLTLNDENASILELVFQDEAGHPILPDNSEDYPALFDEQTLFPERSTFRNSMYFDEIYHARTAYEFIHGMTSYENTHPPLGKIFISLGILLFGMNPWGWRIIGTLFGIAMLPVFYLFAKQLTKSTPVAALSCILFAFDFMHFTQTRIATIDVYITFFVILMYYFMYRYSRMSFYDTPLKKTLIPLGACGICMGLGIASKWTGVYAGAGLAVIFFYQLYQRYAEYRYAALDPEGSTGSIRHKQILQDFLPNTIKTILFCLVFFVLIPVCIYALSYIPFIDYSNNGFITKIIKNQISMFDYHSMLEASHQFASPWYDWPIIRRPVWYYSGIVNETIREGISAFGNPVVWWAGIPAALLTLYFSIKNHDKNALFLLIGYLAQYAPWFLVTRITFMYHYFPSLPFVVLMIGYCISQLRDKLTKKGLVLLVVVYAGAAILLFCMFYPVLSGQPVEKSYVDSYLRWFSSWVLIAN